MDESSDRERASRDRDVQHTANQLHAFELRLSRAEQEHSNMAAIVTKLMYVVWGNGTPGIDKRVDRLEQSEAAERSQQESGRTYSKEVRLMLISQGLVMLMWLADKLWK